MILIAYISITTPGMLAGMTLAAFPIVAHLLNRIARSRRVFPSLVLLRQSMTQHARRIRLRRWLLLILRCLFVAAMVSAFARPVWRSRQGSAVAAAAGNSVVLLVDASASMQTVFHGVTRFEMAKVSAHRVLGDLRSGMDVANVIFIAARPQPVFDELSPNLPALQDILEQQSATEQAGDALAAIRAAGLMLRDRDGPRRLVIVSDRQASNWRPLLDLSFINLLPPATDVSFVDLGTGASKNVAICALRSEPSRPLVGQPISLVAQIENHSDVLQQVRILAEVQTETLPPLDVELQPQQKREIAFNIALERPGPHGVVFRLSHDDFRLDDQCYWVTAAYRGIPVAVVSDEAPEQMGSAAFYLSAALAPHRDASDRFAVEHLTSDELIHSELDRYAAVFVGYVALLDQRACGQLVDYVQRGGGCVLFCGQGNVQRNLLAIDRQLPTGCLPWIPGARQDLYRMGTTRRITDGNWHSPLLRDFDPISQVALSNIEFGSVWQIRSLRPEASVLLKFDDQTPALATFAVGEGQFVAANFSPEVESSDLGKHGEFVALTQIMAQNLRTNGAQPAGLTVGQPLRYKLVDGTAAAESWLIDPSGDRMASSIVVGDEQAELHAGLLNAAGIYSIRTAATDEDQIAVNLDPTESDGRILTADQIRAMLGEWNASAEVVAVSSWEKPIDLTGRPLWGWMVVLAAALMTTELVLLGWWRR